MSDLSQVSYQEFRAVLSRSPGSRVVHRRGRTLIYDGIVRLKAMIVPATIDRSGHCLPPAYFVRA